MDKVKANPKRNNLKKSKLLMKIQGKKPEDEPKDEEEVKDMNGEKMKKETEKEEKNMKKDMIEDTKEDNEEAKCIFHLVNSVKGGSGKSTFALLLADYLTSKDEAVYVIDLDVCGTSWYYDYKKFWEETKYFLNELMYQDYNGEKGFSSDVWSKLYVLGKKDGDSEGAPHVLNVCIAADAQHGQLLDKPEAELLEHSTYHLIMDAKMRAERDKKKKVNIIFDLPPTNEKTVEQICQHLLFSQESKLRKKLKRNYPICFYMMTPIDQPSSLEKNIQYINNLINKRNYSSAISELGYNVCFVINDNHAWCNAQTSSVLLTAIPQCKKYIEGEIDFDGGKQNRWVVESLSFEILNFKKGILNPINSPRLDISNYRYDEIDSIVKSCREGAVK